MRKKIQKKGFTLIELIIVVAVITIISASILTIQGTFLVDTYLDTTTSELVQTLRLAQMRSISQYNDDQWGIYLDEDIDGTEDKFVLFKGSDYANRDPEFDIVSELPDVISLSDITLNGGGNEIIFAKSSGSTSDTGTFLISDNQGGANTITVNAKGLTALNEAEGEGGGDPGPDTTAPSAVSDLFASNPAVDSIDLSWTAPGDDVDTGTATTYDVRYSTSSITEGNWDSATEATGEPTPSTAGSSESMTVSGLEEGETYYFAIKTSDEVLNQSEISNISSETTTAQEQNPLSITGQVTSNWYSGYCYEFIIENISDETTHNWQIDFDETEFYIYTTWNGDYESENDHYIVTPHSWNNEIDPGDSVDDIGYCAIKQGDDYLPDNIEVSVPYSGNAELSYDIVINDTWEEGYCADIHVTNSGDGTAYTWLTYMDTNQSSLTEFWSGYFDIYSGNIYEITPESWNSQVDPGETITSPGFCADKTGANYMPTIVEDPESDTTAPSAVSDLSASNPATDSIDLSWTAPGDDWDTGTATTYDVRYSTSSITEDNWDSATEATGEPTPSTAGSSESMTVSGLEEDEAYYFAIKTSDEVPNQSNISNITSETTTRTPTNTFRINEYYLASGAFTGDSYNLALNQDLEENYFVIVQGSDGDTSNSGNRGPDENYISLTADPFSTGDLSSSGYDNVLSFTRHNSENSWVGVITVVECLVDCENSGFQLLSVERINHSGNSEGGNNNSAVSWTDIDQVMLMGGVNGAGCDTSETGTDDHKACQTRIWPSSSNRINWERDETGGSLGNATSTVMVVEWGSEWNVQRVNVTGSSGGNGANSTNDYDTASINSVNRNNTWVWGNGWTNDGGIGDAAEGTLITLGDGVNQNSTENKVAVGQEYSDNRSFEVYALTHSDAMVDYRFKSDGDSNDLAYDANVDLATDSTARMALVTNGCNGTGGAYPRPIFSARYLNSTTIRIERRRYGQNFPAWIQGIDLSNIEY